MSTLNMLLRESAGVPRSERIPCLLCARGAAMLTYVALAERSDGMPADYLTSRYRVGAATACLALHCAEWRQAMWLRVLANPLA